MSTGDEDGKAEGVVGTGASYADGASCAEDVDGDEDAAEVEAVPEWDDSPDDTGEDGPGEVAPVVGSDAVEGGGSGDGPSGIPHIPRSKLHNGGRKPGSLGTGGLRGVQRDLRVKAMSLRKEDNPRTRKEIRRCLEIISLLYAAKSQDGAEFRASAALAVDLSGFKHEVVAKAKIRAAKSEAKAAKKGIRAAREAELAERPKDVTF